MSKISKTELPGIRKRGMPQRAFMDVMREDVRTVTERELDAEGKRRWKLSRQTIRCSGP